MKKSQGKFLTAVLILGALAFFSLDKKIYKIEEEKTDLKKSQVIAVENNDDVNLEPKNGYIVKEYNGKVAVFETGCEKPFRTTCIAVWELPVADRQLLKNGINVTTPEELSTVLEDYCS